jgi:F420-dependent oxidoreductase-like protein
VRIGLWLDDANRTLDEVERGLRAAADAGFDTVWLGERGDWDPLTLLAAAGGPGPATGTSRSDEADGTTFGTSIVRTYPRHPLALAAQALTAAAATGNRLVLGIGPGPGPVVEGMYGYPYATPVANLREYLSVLLPALHGQNVSHRGEHWIANGSVTIAGAVAPPVLLSALGPRMLAVAGELADGTIITWAGPDCVDSYIVPTLSAAAAAAGRPTPGVVAGVCLCLTGDPDGARHWVDTMFGAARNLPSYRAMFDRQGVDGPGDLTVAGDEATLEREIRRFADAGVTDLQVVPVGPVEEQARTVAFAASLAVSPAKP